MSLYDKLLEFKHVSLDNEIIANLLLEFPEDEYRADVDNVSIYFSKAQSQINPPMVIPPIRIVLAHRILKMIK
jgi:hypothetical protein